MIADSSIREHWPRPEVSKLSVKGCTVNILGKIKDIICIDNI